MRYLNCPKLETFIFKNIFLELNAKPDGMSSTDFHHASKINNVELGLL